MYEVVGRVLAHGFVLCKFWPTDLCLATLVAALTGSVSRTLAFESFCQYVQCHQESTLRAVLERSQEWDDATHLRLMNILGNYGCRVNVASSTVGNTIEELAMLATVKKPYYCLLEIARGMRCYPTLWNNITEETLVELYEYVLPSQQKVIASILPAYSEDVDLRPIQ